MQVTTFLRPLSGGGDHGDEPSGGWTESNIKAVLCVQVVVIVVRAVVV